jgi:hypothetical protein
MKLNQVFIEVIREGLSQTFSDQCASCARRQYDLTFGCRLRFQTIAFLPLVASIQVRQSATPVQIVRGKTLRQAPRDRVHDRSEGARHHHGRRRRGVAELRPSGVVELRKSSGKAPRCYSSAALVTTCNPRPGHGMSPRNRRTQNAGTFGRYGDGQ